MENEIWNEIQKEAFLKLFANQEGISGQNLIVALENVRNIWKKLYSIVGSDIDPNNDRFSIMDIAKIPYNDKVYLIMRVGLWEFVVIDLNNMRCLSKEESMVLLNLDLFERFKGIDESDVDYFTFESLKKKSLKKVVDHFVENEEVLCSDKRIVHKFFQENGVVGCFTISCDKNDSMVSINDYREGRCNYLFLDGSLKVYGASNLSGNKEFIASLFDGKDIVVPEEVLSDVIKKNLKNKDVVLSKNMKG